MNIKEVLMLKRPRGRNTRGGKGGNKVEVIE